MDARSGKPSSEQAVINWMRQTAIPLQHIEAGNGFTDLQPLKPILQAVRFIGLGETTHGTREFFQIKHRLLEFLVTEMNFNVFTIEASYAACQPINDYILYGKGDRETVLTGQWYVVWDTEEILAMLDWMRAYNQSVPDEKKVTFYGLDITRNGNGRQAVLNYLRKVDPDKVTTIKQLFDALETEENKWPLLIDEEAEKTAAQLLQPLQNLIDYLTAAREALIRSSSRAEFDQALHYTQVMKQWIMANVTDLLPPGTSKGYARSLFMADNLIYLADQFAPEAKFIVWEHNGHICINEEERNLGICLREKYGQASLFCSRFRIQPGSFHTRIALTHEKLLGDLKTVTIPAADVGLLSWYLAQTAIGDLILNLRAPVGDPLVVQWLDTPQTLRTIGWVYFDPSEYNIEVNIAKKYDGILFIHTTTASRPMPNALKTVAARDGL